MTITNTTGDEKTFYKQAVRAALFELPNLTATATNTGANADSATLNYGSGIITSSALTTAAGSVYTLTLSDSQIAGATDIIMADVQLGSATAGMPAVATVTPSAGQVVIVIQNIHGTNALNGTIKVSFVLFRVQPAQL